MPKKQAEVDENPSKAGRQAKRQAADAADNGAGPTSEAPAAKRPRGRPRKAVAAEPLAPKPVATTKEARKSRKKEGAAEPATENPSTSKAATKAPRTGRKKGSRSPPRRSASDAASEAPKRRRASRKPRELGDAVRENPREKEEAPREPPPRPVCLFILGHKLESAREASPRSQPRLLGPRRKARQGKEEGFEQRIDNEAARKEAEEKVGG
nr:RNA-binding protein with serine-rich domain 1-like [Rhipicephalus microplus]